jgi:hypothetical protein
MGMNTDIKFKAGLVLFALSALVLLSSVTAFSATMQLPKGMELKVKLVSDVELKSDKTAKDTQIPITLVDPIVVAGKTLVEAGAKGTAKITEVQKAGDGKPGMIKLTFVDLEPKGTFVASNGAKIKLAGEVVGQGKKKKSLLVFGKATDGKISTSDTYKATVAESIVLESK